MSGRYSQQSDPRQPARRFLDSQEISKVTQFEDAYKTLNEDSFAYSGVLSASQVDCSNVNMFFSDIKGGENANITRSCTLPLSDSDAQLIYDAGSPSPFGRGHELVHDTTYREAHEIKPPHFALSSDLITSSKLLEFLDHKLGHSVTSLRATLNKLNAYSAGGFFKAHMDTPSGEGHIGTLVFCLPSSFTGGEFVIRQHGTTVTFDWSKDVFNKEGPRIAWGFLYSDCEHEILPVKTGTRVTVAYDISINNALSPQHVPGVDSRLSSLLRAFDVLTDAQFLPEGGDLAFGLLHEYPCDSGSQDFIRCLPSRLKSCDAVLLAAIRELKLQREFLAVYDLDSYDLTDSERDDEGPSRNPISRKSPEQLADKTYRHDLWTADDFFLFEGTYAGECFSTAEWGLEKEKELVWVTAPYNYDLQNDYISYGNEPQQDTMYVAVAIRVTLPPAEERDEGLKKKRRS